MALGSLRNHHPVGKDGRMPLQRQWYFDCSPRPVPHRLHCFAYSAFAGFRIRDVGIGIFPERRRNPGTSQKSGRYKVTEFEVLDSINHAHSAAAEPLMNAIARWSVRSLARILLL
jgi:hypothetical protein